MIASFFWKSGKRSVNSPEPTPAQRPMERAEVEKALQRFVRQVKEENDRLAIQIGHTQQALTDRIIHLENKLQHTEKELEQLNAHMQTARFQPESVEPVVEDEETVEQEDILALQDRYKRVFELKKEGLHTDEIAKRLGAGGGEIELILSLAAPHDKGATAHD